MSIAPSAEIGVLHVDDEPDFVDLAATFLEREDPRLAVRPTTDVGEALSLLEEDGINCDVGGYEMPGRDGLEFLELVRDRYPDLPFILFTGKGSEEIASKAISAGVSDYLQKETGTDQYTVLANRILTLVRSRRAETAAERTEERYHNLVDAAPLPILLFDESKRAVYVNDAAVEFFDAETKADLENRPFTDLLHPEDRERSERRFRKLMSEAVAVPEAEYRVETVAGTVKRATVATAPGTYQGEPVAQAIVRYGSSE